MNEHEAMLVKSALAALSQHATFPADVELARMRLRDVLGQSAALSAESVERRVTEAMSILQRLGLPANRLAAFTVLAFTQVGPEQVWSEAQRKSLRLHDVLVWIGERYGVHYAENTRESLRRDVIAKMVQAGILEHNPDSPGLPPNHPKNHYAISISTLENIRQQA